MAPHIDIWISKKRLIVGEPCWNVGGEWWRGFETNWGVIIGKTGEGRAWLEFHNDPEHIREGGLFIEPVIGTDLAEHNLFPKGQLDRLFDDETLRFAAVNRPAVGRGDTSACTTYHAIKVGERLILGASLRPSYRFECVKDEGMVTRSATVTPSGLVPELTFWIESTGQFQALP